MRLPYESSLQKVFDYAKVYCIFVIAGKCASNKTKRQDKKNGIVRKKTIPFLYESLLAICYCFMVPFARSCATNGIK